ncbi:hypothetical protein DAEQUDRAFT_769141 [Daedalea quercina L-15889]|uniref:Uncharacterized protein n=1 Tax=Daedalea quercina L-15889 TaxID=1314783 RepID=A0A165M0U3_9APHY|nr:hypothetical protein DAEQUDRAFT_769141 [Daedalea quercina L-15889]
MDFGPSTDTSEGVKSMPVPPPPTTTACLATTPVDEHTAALWDVERRLVHLQFDHYQRYHLDAAPQWAALVPNDGLVYVANVDGSEGAGERQAWTLSMFHQLRCLDVVRVLSGGYRPPFSDDGDVCCLGLTFFGPGQR